jgi:peptide/nickel transport system substrate-binding protein
MLKRLSVLAVVLGLMLFSLFVSGCSQSKNESVGAYSELKEELILAIGGEPKTGFDPTTGWGRYGSPLFQSTLLTRDSNLKIINDLAVGYEVSDDSLEWVVKLRDDVRFSDGTPLTVADVEYTFETAAKSGSVIDLNNMEKVEAIDGHTVKFTLKQPQSTFVNLLITTGIVPKHAHSQDYAENPVGSGPYKLVQWNKGQQLIVESNPEYYEPKPYFKKITFLYLSEDAAFAAARAGQVDMAVIPAAFAKQGVPGMSIEALESVDNRGIMFPFVKSGIKSGDGLPIGNDVTADLAIRQAINIAVDRQALVDGVLEGYGTPAYTVSDGLPWWNPESVIKDNDLKSAKKILAEAGWKDTVGSGILEKDGVKAQFTLVYPAGDQTRQSLAIATADMIKPLGINIKVEGKSWDDIKKMMHANAVLFGWGSHDPLEMYNLYSSKTAGTGWYNAGYYANPVVDKYLDMAFSATTEKEALEYWQKAHWDGETGFSAKGDAPWAWLVNLKHVYLVKEGLDIGKQKIQPHGHGWPVTDNILEWQWRR